MEKIIAVLEDSLARHLQFAKGLRKWKDKLSTAERKAFDNSIRREEKAIKNESIAIADLKRIAIAGLKKPLKKSLEIFQEVN